MCKINFRRIFRETIECVVETLPLRIDFILLSFFILHLVTIIAAINSKSLNFAAFKIYIRVVTNNLRQFKSVFYTSIINKFKEI